MAAPTKKSLSGSIHRIREFELEKVNLAEEFDILQIVGEGWFGKILLVEHRVTDTEMVLKALPKPYVPLRDFYREFHYGLHLGVHKNIITTYDVAFETAGFYVFSQEYAPLGDLTSNVSDTGIGELHTKRVAKQLASALDYLHLKDLVHRDIKLDNILIFKSDFSRIKLCDFGETRKSQTVIRRRNEWLPYAPPEVLKTPVEETYKAVTSHDVWQYGIVIFVCLTGCLPWQKAALDDPRYVKYLGWHNSSNPLKRQPKLFKLVSSKAQKLFKRFLDPRPFKRPATIGDLHKFMDDRWMAKGINDKNGTVGSEIDELCPSMYSFHSDINEKNKLLHMFYEAGIETTVDRAAKKERIREWIQNSVIIEEDEMENDSSNLNSIYNSDEEEDNIRTALHPIEQNHQRWSSIRYNDEKHINPRTGEVLEKGTASNTNSPPLPYDMQNFQPLMTTAKQLLKDNESPSHGSAKDSAYGSIDFKASSSNAPAQEQHPNGNDLSDPKIYPSQQLQQVLQQSNDTTSIITKLQQYSPSPISNNKITSIMNGQKDKSSNSLNDMRNSPLLKKNTQMSNKKQLFSPMKDTPYDMNSGVKYSSDLANTSNNNDMTMNIVQGNMKINPYFSNQTSNIMGMNPQISQIESLFNMNEATYDNNQITLSESEIDSLKQLKKMLIETKIGLSE